MKRSTKNILILLTAAAMLTAMIPAGVFAADDYGIWFCGKKVTSKNMSGPGWSFDLSKFTLKLNGFSYSGADVVSHADDGTDYYSAIFCSGGPQLTISLSGKNTIALKGVPDDNTIIYALASGADLTFTGNGSLDITTDPISGSNTGIWAKGSLTMNGGTVHVATGGGKSSVPVDCGRELRINKGSLQLETGPAEYPIALWCDGNMTMTGGSVSAVCGNIEQSGQKDEDNRYSYGIRIKNSLFIDGGEIYAKSGDTGTSGEQLSMGLVAMQDMIINGGAITAESGVSNAQSVGCACMGNFFMSAGELTAVGNGVSGIFASSSGTLKMPTTVRTFGLLLNSRQAMVSIDGGTVTAKAGNARTALGISTALRANSSISINGGTVTAETDDMGDQNIGMDIQGSLSIGKNVKKLVASGTKAAVSGTLISGIKGAGYSDMAGKKDKTTVGGGAPLQDPTYKKLQFPEPRSFSFSKDK